MNEAQRAYNLLRGYVNREWDRVKGMEFMDALKELDEPLTDKQASMAEKSDGVSDSREVPLDAEQPETHEAAARSILGVFADADFQTIRHAYEKISRRCQPENFPENSPEAETAQQLLRRATWAYTFLTKNVPSSEKRFKSLEIE